MSFGVRKTGRKRKELEHWRKEKGRGSEGGGIGGDCYQLLLTGGGA